jgi:hypothetical protein
MLAVLAGLIFPAWSLGSEVSDAQNKLLAKRAAEADCYRKLAERIMGLKINSSTLVRDFVTESDQIQTEVDTFIRGIRLGQPRFFEDGSCEVTGEVTYEKVVATLREVHSRHYKGDDIRGSDFKEMETRKECSVIRATGMGAPRPDQPIDQPEGTVSDPGPEEYPMPSVPSLWQRIGPQGRMMAQRAAELDAYRRLAEQLQGFKISSSTSVRDFVTESDQIATDLNTTLRGARIVHVFFHRDEPICEVTLEIPWQKVIATIRDSVTTNIHNCHIKDSVFRETTTRVEKKYFRATGMGIPHERFMNRATATMEVAPPEWISRSLKATGQAAIDTKNKNETQAKLMAQRAAELDAKRNLAQMIAGLNIQSDTSVKDFMTDHDSIRTELSAVIDGAYVKGKPVFTDGMVTVTVELPAARVWKVIADEIKVSER